MQSGKSWKIFTETLRSEYKSGSIELYVRGLEGFLAYLKTDAEGLYQMHLKSENSTDQRDRGEVSRKVKAYMKTITDDGFSISKAQQVRKSLTVFLRSNGFDNFGIKQKLGYIPHHGAEMPSKEDVRNMIELAPNFRSKCLLVFLKESALRIGDALSLNVGDIKEALNPETSFFLINLDQIKTMRPTKTIIGSEGCEYLRKLIEIRKSEGETITDETPLFIDTQTGERLGRTAGTELMRRAGKKAGLKKITAHSLRKFAITAMEIGKINPNILAIIIGKVAGGSWGTYTKPTDTELINSYREAYGNIAIYERGENKAILVEQQKQIEIQRNRTLDLENTIVDMGKQLIFLMKGKRMVGDMIEGDNKVYRVGDEIEYTLRTDENGKPILEDIETDKKEKELIGDENITSVGG